MGILIRVLIHFGFAIKWETWELLNVSRTVLCIYVYVYLPKIWLNQGCSNLCNRYILRIWLNRGCSICVIAYNN